MSVQHSIGHGSFYLSPHQSNHSFAPLTAVGGVTYSGQGNPMFVNSVEADIFRKQKKRDNLQMIQRIKELELKIRYRKRDIDKVQKVRDAIQSEVNV